MGFLTGKTAIITGAGRAVLSEEDVVLSDMELLQLMLRMGANIGHYRT